jgi:hypothetical protein
MVSPVISTPVLTSLLLHQMFVIGRNRAISTSKIREVTAIKKNHSNESSIT